jgi:VCBS repeat-containing protein
MKRIFFAVILSIIATGMYAQHTLNLSGQWSFQIDKEDVGIKEQWFRKQLTDNINLPDSMPEKLKGDKITVNTQWTGSLYDSSYYFNPYMEKFRVEENIKFPFFLTPDKHYVGVAWYQKEVIIPSDWKGERIILYLERPHIESTH